MLPIEISAILGGSAMTDYRASAVMPLIAAMRGLVPMMFMTRERL